VWSFSHSPLFSSLLLYVLWSCYCIERTIQRPVIVTSSCQRYKVGSLPYNSNSSLADRESKDISLTISSLDSWYLSLYLSFSSPFLFIKSSWDSPSLRTHTHTHTHNVSHWKQQVYPRIPVGVLCTTRSSSSLLLTFYSFLSKILTFP